MRSNLLLIILTSLFLGTACADELQDTADTFLASDARNAGINVSLKNVDNGSLLFDLREVPNDKSSMDVFRVFLSIAETQKDTSYFSVTMAYKGDPRFILSGTDYKTIGTEFGTQNPMYTLRTFPQKLLHMNGTPAFPKRSGGLLYLMKVQMEDFGDFNGSWYFNDLKAEYQANVDKSRPDSYDDDEAL